MQQRARGHDTIALRCVIFLIMTSLSYCNGKIWWGSTIAMITLSYDLDEYVTVQITHLIIRRTVFIRRFYLKWTKKKYHQHLNQFYLLFICFKLNRIILYTSQMYLIIKKLTLQLKTIIIIIWLILQLFINYFLNLFTFEQIYFTIKKTTLLLLIIIIRNNNLFIYLSLRIRGKA